MDQKRFSCGIFIDLWKAFDTVNHSILTEKLQHYGIRGIVNELFSSVIWRVVPRQLRLALKYRTVSSSGVPQRAVLGTLLFQLHVKDIQNCSDELKFYLFSDDITLLDADRNLKSLETVVNCELLSVYKSLITNKLSLNTQKCNYIIFHPYQKKTQPPSKSKTFRPLF